MFCGGKNIPSQICGMNIVMLVFLLHTEVKGSTTSVLLNTTEAPSTANVGSTQAPTTANVGSTQANATANVGSTQAPTTANVGSTQANATANVGSTQAPTTANVGSTQAPTTANVGSRQANATSNVGSPQAPTTANVGSTQANITANVGTTQAPTIANVGSTQAPTTSSATKDVEVEFTIINQAFDVKLLNRSSSVFRSLNTTLINQVGPDYSHVTCHVTLPRVNVQLEMGNEDNGLKNIGDLQTYINLPPHHDFYLLLSILLPTQIQSTRVKQCRAGSIQVTVDFKVILTSANAVSTVRNLLNATIRSGVLGSLSVDKNSFIWRSQGDSCNPPDVVISELGITPELAKPIIRSTSYIVQTTVKLNCSSSSTSFEWRIRNVTASGGNYLVSSKSIFIARGTAEWTINKRTLHYGLYLVEFRVSMTGSIGVYGSDVKFLSIKESPIIIAGIVGGSNVRRGYKHVVSLDASPTQDPDVGPGDYSGMNFIWSCKKHSEIFPLSLPVISTSGGTGLGGCFDTGIGRLSRTDRVVYINTGNMDVDTSYHIQLLVVKGGRSDTFVQTIEVVRGDPPQITISCRRNCASSVSTSSHIKLTTNCTTPLQTCRTQLTYVWTMQVSTVPSTWHPITDLQTKLLTLPSSPDIVIKSGALTGGKKYRVSVQVSAASITPGISSYEFNTNAPPSGGTCSVMPLTGEGLKTEFKFSCQNWVDLDQPLTYQFYYMTERGLTSVVSYGANRKAESKLPVGKKSKEYIVDFTFLIIDAMSAATKRNIKVKVNPASTQSEMETMKLLNDASTDVNSLLKAGNVKQATQLANAALETITSTPAEHLKPAEKTKLINDITQQMINQVKVNNLETLTQLTSVIGRATANPQEVSFKTQSESVKALEKMATLFESKSNEGDVLDDRLIEAGGDNMVLSIGNIMNSASQKARITGNKQRDNLGKESEVVAKTTLSLLDKIGGTLLSRKVIGEQPSVVRTASLSMVLGRQRPKDIGETKLEEAGAGFTLPSDDVLKDKIESLKFVDTQMVSAAFNPFTWDSTANKVDSDVTILVLKDDKGNTLSVQGLKKNIEITIPRRGSSPNITANEEFFFLKPRQMRYHKMVIDHVGTAVELKVELLHQVPIKLFIQYNTKPSLRNYDYKTAIPYLPVCINNGESQPACKKDDTLVFLSADLLKTKGTYFIGLLFDKIKPTAHARKKRSCFGHGRQKRSCVEPKDPPHPGNRTIIPVYDPNTDVNYTMSTQQYGCLYWDSKKWVNTGCKAGSNSSEHALQCLCNHLTSFGGNLFVAPNPIDFDVVLLNLKRLGETKNVAVLTTILVFLLLYVIIAVLATRADRSDRKRFGPPISINASNAAGFQYEMTVVTGVWRNCGTTANVAIVIHGTESVSEPIVLSRNMRPSRVTLASGNADAFIISLPSTLGSIEYLNVWHDNSGPSPSWFLNQIVVRDLNNEQVWNFAHSDWIALEKGDGSINKILVPTSPMEMKTFKYSFSYRTSKKFTEDHLWLSVLTKPPYSNFTRLQRATCCMCVLFSAMVSNAMFYNLNKTSEPTIQIGPFKFSWRQIMVGIQSSLISLPVGLVCVALFQYSRPKRNPITKDDNTGENKHCSDCLKVCYSHRKQKGDLREHMTLKDVKGTIIAENEVVMSHKSIESKSKEEGCMNRPSASGLDNTILMNSSQSDGFSNGDIITAPINDHTTNEGILSEFLNLDNAEHSVSRASLDKEYTDVQSGVAKACVSTGADNKKDQGVYCEKETFRNRILNFFFSHSDDNEKQLSLPHSFIYIAWLLCIVTVAVSASFTFIYSLQWGNEISEQWLTSMLVSFTEDLFVIQPVKICFVAIFMACFFRKGRETAKDVMGETETPKNTTENNMDKSESTFEEVKISVPDVSELAKAKVYRTKEKRMFSFGRDLLIYCIFLSLLSIVCYGNRSYHGYQMTKNIMDVFSKFTTSKVETHAKFWDWMVGQFASGIYGGRWYNGAIEPKEEYIGNLKSLMIGMPRLRQLRIQRGSCPISKEVKSITRECSDVYSFDEEYTIFLNLPGWKPLPANEQLTNLTKLCPRPWRYSTAEQLGFFSSWGYFHVYSGGGYVADLGYNNNTATTVIPSLRKHNWIDPRTRAVLLEFAIFNPSTNYISTVTFYYEILPTMFGFTFQRIESLALYPTQSGAYDLFLVCKFLFIVLVIFHIIREGRRIYKMKLRYFKDFWNWVEIWQLISALVVVICYIGKSKMLLDTVLKVRENPYITVNFQGALAWKDAEDVALSVTVFLATIKLITMMRFNPHIFMLLSSLKVSKETMVPYSVILLVIMMSYAQVGMLAFGSTMFEFSSFQEALYSIMLMSLGAKMKFPELIRRYRVAGPLFGFTFKLLMNFIFVNFFVAILNDAFEDVKSNTDRSSKEFEMADFILDRLKEILSLGTKNIERERQDNDESKSVEDRIGAKHLACHEENESTIHGNENYACDDNDESKKVVNHVVNGNDEVNFTRLDVGFCPLHTFQEGGNSDNECCVHGNKRLATDPNVERTQTSVETEKSAGTKSNRKGTHPASALNKNNSPLCSTDQEGKGERTECKQQNAYRMRRVYRNRNATEQVKQDETEGKFSGEIEVKTIPLNKETHTMKTAKQLQRKRRRSVRNNLLLLDDKERELCRLTMYLEDNDVKEEDMEIMRLLCWCLHQSLAWQLEDMESEISESTEESNVQSLWTPVLAENVPQDINIDSLRDIKNVPMIPDHLRMKNFIESLKQSSSHAKGRNSVTFSRPKH